MKKYLQQVKADIDLPLIKKSILFSLIFGFIVHGANYFSPTYCHDSLLYHYQDTDVFWKISLGRFMQALTIPLRGYDNIPLITGGLSLIYIGLSSYIIAKTLDIKNRVSIYCISAIIITSISFISVNLVCFHELDAFMLALLFASIGGYIFNTFRLGYIVAALPIALCCGLYQPYVGSVIMLFMILIVKDILIGENQNDIISKSVKVIVSLILAGLIYFILYKTVALVFNVTFTQSYNSIEGVFDFDFNSICATLFATYWNVIKFYLFPYAGNLYISSFITTTLIAIYMLTLGVKIIKNQKVSAISLLILTIIIGLFPLAINIATFISSGFFNEAMLFPIIFIYVLFLMLIELTDVKRRFMYLAHLLLFVIIFNGATFINRVYIDQSIWDKNSHAIAYDLYKGITVTPEFIDNNNIPILVSGQNTNLQLYGNKYMDTTFFLGQGILFLQFSYKLFPLGSFHSHLLNAYFNKNFKTNFNFVKQDINRDFTLDDELNSMPVYPADGYMKCVRDTIFIKFPTEPQNFGANK
ncbi:MAG: glucosyltransferase domain-containing protein [Rikenellaceae bacterium]